ncbi:PREDICTED: calpain-13 [Condylura cristata]|uniref:calpain-13 n=1 Tax=Condylura cristata TaxID=143302 RepID=UPI0006430D9A|nr:PREDICTED: calpain-13 [Condylura cristata]
MTYYQEHVPKNPVVNFNGQDFYSLRDQCLRRGHLFEDDTFPISPSSIGLQLFQKGSFSSLQWKRPQDLSNGSPHFILEGASRFDIQQGLAGDCWFLAALGALTQNPQYLQKILLDQSFSHQYVGIFRFRFWQCGQWVEVVVDDRLPIVDRKYLFVHPRRDNQEFWPCLLEKAYAKFRGSYLHLHFGYLADALVDLTGGVVTSFDLHSFSTDLVMMVKTAAKAGSLITCATPVGPTGQDTELENGLVSQHAYTVTGAEQIRSRRGWEDLIRLWNPWGKTEWRGRWKDGSLEWKEMQDHRKNLLHDNKEDGEFWMSCQDFQENFSCLFICNQVPISLAHGHMACERWSQMAFKDRVIPGTSAGLQKNVQYIFSVPDNAQSNNVVVSFTIMPRDFKTEEEKFPLSFEVFKVDSQFQHFQEKLPSTFFSQFRSGVKAIVSKTKCNLTKHFTLPSGTYVVAASARKEAIEFLARIFLKMPDCDRQVFQKMTGRRTFSTDMLSRFCFFSCSHQGVDIDAMRLQRLLNQELLRGRPEDTFSLDQCRSMVALMDLKVDGRLDEEEFSRLWSRLLHCRSVFQNIQKYSGIFLTSDLCQAIQKADFLAGVSITNDLLDLMTLRYSDNKGKVTFPNLACLLVRLEAMSRAFRNLSKDGRGIYLTEMQWMKLVMYT